MELAVQYLSHRTSVNLGTGRHLVELAGKLHLDGTSVNLGTGRHILELAGELHLNGTSVNIWSDGTGPNVQIQSDN